MLGVCVELGYPASGLFLEVGHCFLVPFFPTIGPHDFSFKLRSIVSERGPCLCRRLIGWEGWWCPRLGDFVHDDRWWEQCRGVMDGLGVR